MAFADSLTCCLVKFFHAARWGSCLLLGSLVAFCGCDQVSPSLSPMAYETEADAPDFGPALPVPFPDRQAPLERGEMLPELTCAGWIGGPHPGATPIRLAVIDVWGQWCSEVPKAIPGLRQLQSDYADQGVIFLSLTTESQSVVAQFVEQHQPTWPFGFGASLELVNRCGALNDFIAAPGYEVKPLLYIADAQGRILDSDLHLRMDHNDADKSQLLQRLREILNRELAGLANDS